MTTDDEPVPSVDPARLAQAFATPAPKLSLPRVRYQRVRPSQHVPPVVTPFPRDFARRPVFAPPGEPRILPPWQRTPGKAGRPPKHPPQPQWWTDSVRRTRLAMGYARELQQAGHNRSTGDPARALVREIADELLREGTPRRRLTARVVERLEKLHRPPLRGETRVRTILREAGYLTR